MGFALFAQHVLLLDPCPLCVFQRVAVISIGIIFLVAALHNPDGAGRIVYGVLLALAAGGGAAVAGRHAWLQQLPPDQVPSCGPGLDYMLDTLPFTEVLSNVFRGSGECAEIVWQFLGLSMPGWVLVWMIALGGAGLWNNLRRG
jgi:disulfide bond formation protein DsbB